MRHRGEAAGVAWAPMLCSGYLVVSPFDLLRVRVPPRPWVRVRVRVPLLQVPPRVMRMRLPVQVPSVRLMLIFSTAVQAFAGLCGLYNVADAYLVAY